MRNLPCILYFVSAVFLGTAAAYADPPARVGRLSYMEGTVSFRTPSQTDWSAATVNYPVTSGTSFWTEPDAKTEIEAGPITIRMDQATELDVTHLDDSAMQFSVPQGAVYVRLYDNLPQPLQIETPRGEIDLTQAGSYHIDTGPGGDPSAPVEATVLQGSAQFQGRIINAGQRATIEDNGAVTINQDSMTPFDDWAASRDQEAAPLATNYVSPQMTGYQDLDAYGQWSPDPTYGTVWYPSNIGPDWAPYSYGHWVFVEPWGWTWVDDAPWGFAPFHYGRWVHTHDRWGWWPGQGFVAQPVYAPALVAFIGGPGWNIRISAGGLGAIGWVPLAPFEPFHPYYHASDRYITNINITNVHREDLGRIGTSNWHDASHFANRGAITVVHGDAFTHAAPVHNARVSISQAELGRAPLASDVSHFTPTANARSGGTAPGGVPAPHRAAVENARPAAAPGNYRRSSAPAPHPAFENHTAAPLMVEPSHALAPGPHPAPREESVQREPERSPNISEPAMHRPAIAASPQHIPHLPANTIEAHPTAAPRPTPRPYEVRHAAPVHEQRPNTETKSESKPDDREHH